MRTCILLLLSAAFLAAQFTPASTTACAMAHCDSTMSDQAILTPPLAVQGRIIDSTGGANIGLGCSTNNTIVACAGQASTNGLTVYDRFGNKICTSGSQLDNKAYFSAPGIDAAGKVAAADSNHVVMFDTSSVSGGLCSVVWSSAALNGSPVSLVFDPANNLVLAATTNGLVYSIYATGASQGTVKNSVTMTFSSNTYQTSNTPCVQGGKIFIVAQRVGLSTDEKMFAYNTVDLSNASGWASNPSAVTLTGPPFASPTCAGGFAIFDDSTPAAIFIKQSDGTAASFSPVSIPAAAIASFGLDLRTPASVWVAMLSTSALRRINIADGTTAGNLTLTDTDGNTGFPGSALTMAGTAAAPYLITGMSEANNRKVVAMFNLLTNTAVWTLYPDSAANGQFPVVQTGDANAVFFTSKTGGVWRAAAPGKPIQISGGVTVSSGGTVKIQ